MLSEVASGLKTEGVREKQKRETRAALLGAARRVLAVRGFAATTTREIAQEAKVAAGTFFVHFPSVAALVEALLDEHVQDTLQRGLRLAEKKQGIVAQLMHASNTLFESYDEAPELARAFITGSLFIARDGAPSPRALQYRAWVTARIDQAVSSGELQEIDRDLAYTCFFSIYFGLLVAGLNGQLTRKRQLALLRSALTRLLLLEAS